MADEQEVKYWKTQALTSRRTQLDVVRKAAAAWTTFVGAVLGVFGTVTFAGGLTALDKVGAGGFHSFILGATLAAVTLMLVSTVFGGLAANSYPKVVDNIAWDALRNKTKSAALKSLCYLRISLYSGLFTAIIVVVGSGALLVHGETSSPPEAPTVVVVQSGVATCGPLAVNSTGGIGVNGGALQSPSWIVTVAACPSPTATGSR